MSTSAHLMQSILELRARCNAVIAERQAPLKARQRRLRNLDLPNREEEAARLTRDASESDSPEQLLEKAAALLVGDDKATLMRQLGEEAAELIDKKLDEIERKAGGVGRIGYVLASIREQATKVQIARVGQIGRSGLVDANLERYLGANVGAFEDAVSVLRDSMSDARVTQACNQLVDDLREFIDSVKSVEAV